MTARRTCGGRGIVRPPTMPAMTCGVQVTLGGDVERPVVRAVEGQAVRLGDVIGMGRLQPQPVDGGNEAQRAGEPSGDVRPDEDPGDLRGRRPLEHEARAQADDAELGGSPGGGVEEAFDLGLVAGVAARRDTRGGPRLVDGAVLGAGGVGADR